MLLFDVTIHALTYKVRRHPNREIGHVEVFWACYMPKELVARYCGSLDMVLNHYDDHAKKRASIERRINEVIKEKHAVAMSAPN